MKIFMIAPRHIRKRMCANEVVIHVIGKKIGADCELRLKEILFGDPRPTIALHALFEYPKDTLIYLAPDIPKHFPWKDYMDTSKRIVVVASYMRDLFEVQPFLVHARKTNRNIELYFLNKEEFK